ncbi:hypothetical protein J2Y38_002123 [Flavobacterium sp. 2755]|uniref:DUF4276 family protein n=1 Tax=Flavobacterium sp. 2755 TaxID=2817765 RepID=UPI0028566D21|nr:DUF4276 family protein [Flavobacterium sp. 2755]MDR6761914.1 hypothetical protein [Flavobacterium sp. 2755]
MKRIIIICEGQTEQQFCNDVLQSYFNLKNIFLQNPTISKTGGGIVNWEALKHQVVTHLKQDSTSIVTTLIDFYGIHANHKYPNWQVAKLQQDKSVGMDLMEEGMQLDIPEDLRKRFVPYVQLHEFEAILFSDINVYDNNFEPDEFLDYKYLVDTINDNANPEMINDGVETAPSKRLSKILKGYYSDNENMKVFYGSLLSHDIGILQIKNKCPRFNEWLSKLENI